MVRLAVEKNEEYIKYCRNLQNPMTKLVITYIEDIIIN